ncbi:MAG: hypothetical protein V4594_19620 [Bacteroidota bacterium]
MKNSNTPAPGSEDYDVNQPQDLNKPKYNSTTEKRGSAELPAVENMNDQQQHIDTHQANDTSGPETDLGNDRAENEKEKERIIRR